MIQNIVFWVVRLLMNYQILSHYISFYTFIGGLCPQIKYNFIMESFIFEIINILSESILGFVSPWIVC